MSGAASALKDASLAAFVALILAVPLVGFETVDLGAGKGMGLAFRGAWIGIGVGGVFAGRLALSLLRRAGPALAAVRRRT
ncbi:MAG: DUF3382 domain-containing protein, partial [Stellaceae bacterium]